MLASCSQDHFIRVWRISHGSDDYMKSDENKNEDNMEPLELTSSKMTIINNGMCLFNLQTFFFDYLGGMIN